MKTIPITYVDTNKYIALVSYDDFDDDPTGWGQFNIEQYDRNKIHYTSSEEHYTEAGKLRPELQAKIRAGIAWPLEAYEHGNIRYSLSGEGMQCRFDTSGNIGMLFLKDVKGMSYKEREQMARECLREYNAYCNGEVYTVQIKRDTGYIVSDYCGGITDIDEYIKQELPAGAEYEVEYTS